MGVIVDTSVWIDVERRALTHVEVAERVENDAVFLAPQVVAELQYGVERASTPEQRNRRSSALAKIRRKPCLIVDRTTGEIFGQIAAQLDRTGTPATHRTHDLWIAALAIQHGYRILTRNAKDFQDIPGLDVVVM
jgi:predicted nucleic acid-binding protein